MTKVINLRKHTKFKTYKRNNGLKKREKSNINTQEKYKIFISVISMFSIIIGCVLYKANQIVEINELQSLVDFLQKSSFAKVFLFFVKYELICFLIEFFIGTSLVGVPLAMITPAIKCIFIGIFSSYMYNQYEIRGILFCLVLLYPFYAITTSSLIFAANESFYMSKNIFNMIIKKNPMGSVSINLYLIRYLFLIVINVACSLVNSFMFITIAPRFNFS